jgi:hypothetical protein
MILVEVAGVRGGKVESNLHDIIMDAAYYFAKKLGMNRYKGLLSIRIPKNVGDLKDGAAGYAVAEKTDVWEGDILLANYKDDINEMISVLAHEMVHIKQFMKKELSECGKYFGHNIDSKDPWEKDCPWEREAYLWGPILAENYLLTKQVK